MRAAAFGIVPVAIAAAAAPLVHGPDAFGAIALVYLALALGALALYQAPDPDRPLRGYAAQWAAGALAVLAIAAVLTVVAAAIDPSALGLVAPIGKPLAFIAENAFKYILGPPLAAIGWLFSLIPLPHNRAQEQLMQSMPPEKRPDEQDQPLWTRIVGWVVAGGLLTLVLLATLAVLWMLFRRFAKQKQRKGDRREHVEAESSLADDLGAAFDALARRFRRTRRVAQSSIEVRRLYHEMLVFSAAAGLERPLAATPLQFAPRLDAHFASDTPTAISRAFAESRYGGHDVEPAAVDDLRDRWRRIATPRPP
jgi:multisubunit Na+/H+ antiporter MnhB subunit